MNQELIVQPENGIVTYDIRAALQQAADNIGAVREFVARQMEEGVDFGAIPGAGDRKVLLKPGAEKLDGLFNVRPAYTPLSVTENPETGYAMYRYQADLVNRATGAIMGSGIGSCNSFESKYRWRWVPKHAVPIGLLAEELSQRGGKLSEFAFAIDKGETTGQYGKPAEYWQTFRAAIESGQAVAVHRKTKTGKMMDAWEIDGVQYRIPNGDIMDVWNTVDKMAQKRALVAAALTLGCVSDLFTQDLEDFVEEDNGSAPRPRGNPSPQGKQATSPHPTQAPPPTVTGEFAPASLEELMALTVDTSIEKLAPEWVKVWRVMKWAVDNNLLARAWAGSAWNVWVSQGNLEGAKKDMFDKKFITREVWEAL